METDVIHIQAWVFGAISAFIGVLLSIIAWFLSRGISKFDEQAKELNAAVKQLTSAIGTFDGDMKGMHQQMVNFEKEIDEAKHDVGLLYQRMNTAEKDIAKLNAGGCDHKHGCAP